MGLFDGITNPWANGGLHGSSPKWAQPGQEHGWGGSDSTLNPPTKEQQRDQENLQLAIVAASAVAPDMVAEEQRNGGGTQQVEFDPDGGAPSQQSAAVNTSEPYPPQAPNGESEFNSPYGSAQSAVGTVLTPFKYPNSTDILRRAAIAGERHLNEALHRFSGQPDLTIHGAYMREYHASITLLLGLMEEIGKNVGLRHELRQLASFSISRLSRPSLDRISRLVRENLPMENVSKALESVLDHPNPSVFPEAPFGEENLKPTSLFGFNIKKYGAFEGSIYENFLDYLLQTNSLMQGYLYPYRDGAEFNAYYEYRFESLGVRGETANTVHIFVQSKNIDFARTTFESNCLLFRPSQDRNTPMNPNDNFLIRTDIALARTVIHESIHAYLYWRYDHDSNFREQLDTMNFELVNYFGDQHEYMARFLREDLVSGMKEFANDAGISGLSEQDFETLSWVGLQDTGAFRQEFPTPQALADFSRAVYRLEYSSTGFANVGPNSYPSKKAYLIRLCPP
jgi:hypothetical protein